MNGIIIQLLHTCHFYSSIRSLCNNIMLVIIIINNNLFFEIKFESKKVIVSRLNLSNIYKCYFTIIGLIYNIGLKYYILDEHLVEKTLIH